VSELRVSESDGRVRFSIRVQPRASRNEIAGVYGEALRIRLSAPPVDGAANAELIEFLAEIFVVGRRSVKILSGENSRSKIVEIEGTTERAVREVAAGAGR